MEHGNTVSYIDRIKESWDRGKEKRRNLPKNNEFWGKLKIGVCR
jgi:hypothetical protein